MKFKELLEAIAWAIFMVAMLWMFCKLTPSQLSGEADWSVQEAEDAGIEYCPRVP